MTISTMMHGEYGIEDVCLSTLSIVGNNGIRSNVYLPLNDEEIAKLRHSADTLKAIIKSTVI
jgi:L-lactate dehydrogenase